MDRYVEKCQSDWEFKGKQKKSLSGILGRNLNLFADTLAFWRRFTVFFSFCFDVYKNQEKQSEKVFLTCRLPFPAEEPLSQTRLNIRP